VVLLGVAWTLGWAYSDRSNTVVNTASLEDSGSLRLRIVTHDLKPLANNEIRWEFKQTADSRGQSPEPKTSGRVYTDAMGELVLRDFPPGRVRFSVSLHHGGGFNVILGKGEDLAKQARLPEPTIVTGRVYDSNTNKPIPGAIVDWDSGLSTLDGESTTVNTTTDDDGRYSLAIPYYFSTENEKLLNSGRPFSTQAPINTIELEVTPPPGWVLDQSPRRQFIGVKLSKVGERIELDLPVIEGQRFFGRVYGPDGEPLEQMQSIKYNVGQGLNMFGPSFSTDRKGQFDVTMPMSGKLMIEVATGSYYLRRSLDLEHHDPNREIALQLKEQ
jgi:hypothetical protein